MFRSTYNHIGWQDFIHFYLECHHILKAVLPPSEFLTSPVNFQQYFKFSSEILQCYFVLDCKMVAQSQMLVQYHYRHSNGIKKI